MVKAVMAKSGQVLYFSRAPIPYHRSHGFQDGSSAMTYRHLGLYIYRREALERFCSLPPSDLERLECLEQLRALEDNISIHAVVVKSAPVGIDTPEDLTRLSHFLSQKSMAR